MCNTSLGTFEFQKETAHKAAVYLRKIVDDWVVEPTPEKQPYTRIGDLPF